MKRRPYRPDNAEGIFQMLIAFDTNINADSKALAHKYGVEDEELARISQGRLVWGWFMAALGVARNWGVSLTETRDLMETGAKGSDPIALPGAPTLPPVPMVGTVDPTPAELEPGFFGFFTALVTRLKNTTGYDIADGQKLGIEGPVIDPPNPSIVPIVTGELFTSGQPELTCKKGLFQGYTVWLTRPGQARKVIGFSTGRRFNVTEALPAAGTAEVWIFEVQYRYQDQPFGQVSQPLSLTVRGS